MDGSRHLKHVLVGQGLVEYALILALTVLVVVLVLSLMGEGIANVFCKVVATLGYEEICSDGCRDDFTDMADWEVASGSFEIVDGKLCNTPRQGSLFSTCSGQLPSNDYAVSLDGVSLEGGNGYGVWFRTSENDQGRLDGYTFQYDPGLGGAFVFRKWVNGYELAPIATKKVPGFDWYGTDHDIQLVVEGNTFKALVDGEVVLETQDDTYAQGSTGIRTWDDTRVCVDGFTTQPTWP